MAILAVQEDSVRKCGMYNVVCYSADGRKWVYRDRFNKDDVRAGKLLAALSERMSIDTSFWREVTRKTKGWVCWSAF